MVGYDVLMPLDPDVAALLAMQGELDRPPITSMTPAEARRRFHDEVLAARTDGELEPVRHVRDEDVGGLTLRVVIPYTGDDLPCIVYLHGGGWVLGDNDVHEPSCRALANRAAAVVVSPEYRLAPDHPFPAALDDTMTALRWATGRHTTVAVAGNSAGGNLAAAACLRARDEGGPTVAAQLLVYPATDPTMSLPAYAESASAPNLDAEEMAWYYDAYLPDDALRTHPYAGPLHAPDLSGLPPAVVVTAGHDPLRDDGDEYAARLAAAGVAVTHLRYDDLVHGFVGLAESIASCRRARDEAYEALARLLRERRAGQ